MKSFRLPFFVFQLTPSRRATLLQVCPAHESLHFNSRPHGGRQRSTPLLSGSRNFNSRPHGGRPFRLMPSEPLRISTHALTEGDKMEALTIEELKHFNSRPHGGRPRTLQSTIKNLVISTHALTEGDNEEEACHLGQSISTHALTEGDAKFVLYSCDKGISTHALTEGDGKFRQIFLLNRGYAYSISLYFLPHFISLLPQILSFQQKSFKFQVRIFLLFSVHLAFALQNQCVHHVKSRFCTNMFYFVFVLFTQIVKPQTIGLFIYDFF